MLRKDERLVDMLMNEFNILRGSDHPHVVKIFEMYEDDKSYYIVSEQLSGGELFEVISMMADFNEKIAAKLIKQVLEVLAFIHAQNIVHRDLKPENIMFEKSGNYETVKVVDFGFAKMFDPE